MDTTTTNKRSTKYVRHSCLPGFLINLFEWFRWTINRILLFRPFGFTAKCDCPMYLNEYLYLLTIGELIFWLICGMFLVFAVRSTIRGEGTQGEDSARAAGSVASVFFASTWLLGQRNTLWNMFFGLSFERGIVFHKYLGRVALILALFHAFGFANKIWINNGQTGVIAIILAILIFITSIDYIRRNLFNVFLLSHWILVPLFLFFAIAHGAGIFIYPFFLTLIDLGIRAYYNFAKKVNVIDARVLSSNVIRIQFDKKRFTYHAGQYVFICIPAISFWEWHPFSLSTHPHDDTVTIHIRVLGNWTQKLHHLISSSNVPDNKWNNLKVFIEGPYGSLNVKIDKYSHVALVSGGIGITPMQSIFNDIVSNVKSIDNGNGEDGTGTVIKRIHFIWSVRDPYMFAEFGQRHLHWAAIDYNAVNRQNQSMEPVKDEHDDIESQQTSNNKGDEFRLPKFFSPDLLNINIDENGMSKINDVEIITHFYLTRVNDKKRQEEFKQKFPFVKFGRPNIDEIIKETKDSAIDGGKNGCYNCLNGKGYGVAVLSCGPKSMLKDVKKYSARYNVDCHTEIFEF